MSWVLESLIQDFGKGKSSLSKSIFIEKFEIHTSNAGRKEVTTMEKKIFYDVEDVMTMLMISKSHAYKIIRELNQELKAKGYMTITGRVSCQYFDEKFYGLQTA